MSPAWESCTWHLIQESQCPLTQEASCLAVAAWQASSGGVARFSKDSRITLSSDLRIALWSD